jgi:hypothetical protein
MKRLLCLLACVACLPLARAGNYQNFTVSVYIQVRDVNTFADPKVLQSEWDQINSQVKVDKVYIEVHRDRILADEQLLETVKAFFTSRGVQVAAGSAFSDSESDLFKSFCYTNPADRDFVKKVAERAARHFDEFILDDFFFNNTKLDSDIAAKGDRSWTNFRTDLMTEAGQTLIVNAAKAVNPKIKVVIKFPNWYEHFQGLGFDLSKEPGIFDGIYTGTETRDPTITDQFLQQYESYEIIRCWPRAASSPSSAGATSCCRPWPATGTRGRTCRPGSITARSPPTTTRPPGPRRWRPSPPWPGWPSGPPTRSLASSATRSASTATSPTTPWGRTSCTTTSA